MATSFTEIYVDPSIAANSGSGTIGDPYGDLEYAIVQTPWDGTNGIRVNVKAGAAEGLSTPLNSSFADTSVGAAWAPSQNTAVVIQGYTSTAGDGGIGEINNGGLNINVISAGQYSGVHFADMKMGNTGSATIIDMDNFGSIERCELHTTSSGAAINVDNYALIQGNYIHDIGASTNHVAVLTGTDVRYNLIDCGGNGGGITLGNGSICEHNIIYDPVSGANAIVLGAGCVTVNNVVYSTVANVGTGIFLGAYPSIVANNIICGFSGTGGKGMLGNTGDDYPRIMAANAFYNCTTNKSMGSATYTSIHSELEDLEITLSADPFTDASTLDFTLTTAGATELRDKAFPALVGLRSGRTSIT